MFIIRPLESLMKKATLVLFLLCPFTLWAQAKPEAQTQSLKVRPAASSARNIEELELTPGIVTQHARIQRLIGPRTKQRISQIAPGFSARVRQLPPTSDFHALAVAEVRSGFQGSGNLSNEDVEALAFLVMMQAAKDAQSDLNNIMDGVKNANRQKQDQRAARNQKDTMSDMSEEESLRLQMMMDRRSKFIQAMSNIEKKIAETQDSLVQNLK
jgi:hypothetical protein